MSSSTKMEVSHDQREIEPKHRRSSRLNRKIQVVTQKIFNLESPNIIKSPSSTGNDNLETLYSTNKGSPKVSEKSDNKSKSSSKMSFWGSPDLSPGIESYLMQ
jgi:hypothetical protein